MAGAAVGVVLLVIVLVIVLIIALAFIGWYISTSNAINRVNLKIDESLSSVEIMLRQRGQEDCRAVCSARAESVRRTETPYSDSYKCHCRSA